MSEKIVQIPIEKIQPHPNNRKIGGFDQTKLEQLADSIRTAGVLQPAVVRPWRPCDPASCRHLEGMREICDVNCCRQCAHQDGCNSQCVNWDKDSDLFEIIAGERRWRAARLAGLSDLPCVIRQLTDVQALEVMTIENLQREDLHPLDEADGYARLRELGGYEVEAIAEKVGKSASYVYQRLKLKDLAGDARKAFEEEKITAGHAILLARLQPAHQRQALKSIFAYRDGLISVREFTNWIQGTLFHELTKAPWKKDDPDLDSDDGACKDCPKRSGFQPDLFADVCKKDTCTDPTCWDRKLDAFVKHKEAELKERGAKYFKVFDHSVEWNEQQELQKKGVHAIYSLETCKKSDTGAVPVLMIAGDNRGQISYGKQRETSKYGQYKPTAAEKRAHAAEALKEKAAKTYRRLLWSAVMEAAQTMIAKGSFDVELDRFIVHRIWQKLGHYGQEAIARIEGWQKPKRKKNEFGSPWSRMGDELIGQAPAEDLVLWRLKTAVANEIMYSPYDTRGPRYLEGAAELFGIDAKKIRKEAAAGLAPKKGASPPVQLKLKEKYKARNR